MNNTDNKQINKKTSNQKIFEGVVVSHNHNHSVVSVDRFVKHSRYGKYISVSKKYHAHDDVLDRKIGDKVSIKQSRPLSKLKRFIIVKK